MMGSAALEEILCMKGYLLNVSAIRRYSLLLKVKKLMARSCWDLLGIYLGSMGLKACVTLCCVYILHLFT